MSYDYYQDFSDEIHTKLDEIFTRIEAGVKEVWVAWDNSIAAKGLDSNWGWLAPGPKLAYEHFKSRLEENIKKLWDDFKQFCEDLWAKVDEMAGSPFALMSMNAAYIKAASRIRDEKTVISDLSSEVGKHWSGVAFTSYNHVALDEQMAAIAGVDDGISKAAEACAEGAKQLRSIWRDVIDALLDVLDTIFDAIKDGTDAGQWVTFDAGPAIKVVGKALTSAIRLWNKLDTYFDDNATVNLAMWRQLNAGLEGLDAANRWPSISSRDNFGRQEGWGQN